MVGTPSEGGTSTYIFFTFKLMFAACLQWFVLHTLTQLLITQCLSSYNSGYCCYYYYFTKPSRWQFENLCRKSEPVRIRAGTSNQSTPTTQREEEEEEDDDDNDDNDDNDDDDDDDDDDDVDDDDDDNFFFKQKFFNIFFQNKTSKLN